MIKIACAAAALTGTLLLASGSQAPDAELEGIKKTALDYGQGWYEGNAERMERALHPDLAKRVLMTDPRSGRGRINHMGALRLVQATRSGAGTKVPTDVRRTDVTVLDVYGRAASVKLEMHDWIDYLHMSKMGDRWVIVNVLWELTPEAKKRRGIGGGS
ncbi:MAG: nuclear transport factor 2 family protein [bacterium]|nr:nuclear transport factor 2 family protein [bacterium]